jgi:hypothetical protein
MVVTIKIIVFWDVKPCSLVVFSDAASMFKVEESLKMEAEYSSETSVSI